MATARSCTTCTAEPETSQKKAMEFVALSDTVLRYLARDDPELKRVFWDVVPTDGLPQPRTLPRGPRASSIRTLGVNRASIGWPCGRTRAEAVKSSTVTVFPYSPIQPPACTNGWRDDRRRIEAESPCKRCRVKRVAITRCCS